VLRILLSIFAITLINLSYCQQLEFKYFNTSNGLPSNYIFHVLNDQQNYLWIATDKGVTKFDGSKFDNILDTVMVYKISETKSGKIWLCTYEHGAIQVNKKTLDITLTIIPKSSTSVYDFKEDDYGRWLIRTYNGLEVIDNGKSKIYKDSINQTPNNHIIKVGNNKFIFRINGLLNIYESTSSTFSVKPLNSDINTYKCFTGNKNIYFMGDSLNLKNNLAQGKIITRNFWGYLALKDSSVTLNNIKTLKEATSFCSWNGYSLIGTIDNGVQLINNTPYLNTSNGLRCNFVTSICTDTFNQLWVGTFGGGVQKIAKTNYTILPNISEIVNTVNIDNKGNIYAGTTDTLHIITQSKQHLKLHQAKFKNIRAITFDNSNRTYIGTFLSLISSKNLLDNHEPLTIFKHGNGISGIIPNSDGTVWISSYGSGIWLIDKNNNVSELIDSLLPTLMINRIFKAGNAIWATTDKGAIRIENGKQKMLSSKNGLISNYTGFIFEDYNKTIWIGCSNGICNFSPTTDSVMCYSKGFKGNKVVSIFRDNKDQLLVLSNTTLHILSNNQLIPLNSYTLVPSSDFTINNAQYYPKTSSLLLATSKGVVTVNLQNVKQGDIIPELYISELKSDTAKIDANNQPIILEPENNKLSIKVGIHYLSNTEDIKWRYWLEGTDKEWSEPTSNFELNYPQLPYGKVKLWAKSINPDGVESQPQLLLSAIIKTPFYQRWYSVIIELSLLIAAIALIVKFFTLRRIKKRMHEMEVRQKIHAERQRIARDLHDNVGSQLTYLITNLDQLSNEGNSKAKDLSAFGRNAIGQLRETIWAIHSDYTDIEDFVDGLRKMCYQYLNGCNVEHSIDAKIDYPISLTPIQTLNLYRIAQESVTNIVKHSKASMVKITVRVNAHFTMTIADNGVGTHNPNDQGYGLNNMKNRAKEIGAEFIIETEKGTGTTIKVIFPVNKN